MSCQTIFVILIFSLQNIFIFQFVRLSYTTVITLIMDWLWFWFWLWTALFCVYSKQNITKRTARTSYDKLSARG